MRCFSEELEFIIAVLYRLAHSDHIYHDEEDKAIREVARVFGVEKTYIDIFKETTVKFFKCELQNPFGSSSITIIFM